MNVAESDTALKRESAQLLGKLESNIFWNQAKKTKKKKNKLGETDKEIEIERGRCKREKGDLDMFE